MEQTCKYCGKILSVKGRNHIAFCKQNPERKIVDRKGEKNPRFGKKGTNQYANPDYVESEEVKKNRIDRLRLLNEKRWNQPGAREKMSLKIREAIKRNPESYSSSNVSGRAKIYEYREFRLKGTWELKFAEWLDRNFLEWTNKIEGFEYEWQGAKRTYFPDFYIKSLNLYVEIKGYERERDIEKWKSVKNLVVIKKDVMKRILTNSFTLEDFHKWRGSIEA